MNRFCETCGKSLTIKPRETRHPSHFLKRRFCNRQCSDKYIAQLLRASPPFLGRRHKPESLNIFRVQKLGNKNPLWKGDKVGYRGLHQWMRKRKEKPLFCVLCKQRTALDLANISGKYTRNLDDWQWLCRKCHMELDGRLRVLTENHKMNFLGLERRSNGTFISTKRQEVVGN